MKTRRKLALAFLCGLVVGMILAPRCSPAKTYVDFAPKHLRMQTNEDCGPRFYYMGEAFPLAFWAPGINDEECPQTDRGYRCWEDGSTRHRFRFIRRNSNQDTVVTMHIYPVEVGEIDYRHQWIDETYRQCLNGSGSVVDYPGAYAGELISTDGAQEHYPHSVLDDPSWEVAYYSNVCPINGHPDPWEQDRMGSQVSNGIFMLAYRIGGSQYQKNWAELMEIYIDGLDGNWSGWTPEMAEAVLWYREEVLAHDPHMIIGRVGVAVDTSTWGQIKRTYK